MRSPVENRYIGSVRFFKHIFLCTIFIITSFPLMLCFHFAAFAHQSNQELTMLQTEYAMQLKARHTDASTDEFEHTNLLKKTDHKQLEAETPHYQELYSDLYVTYPEHFTTSEKKTVYLTFDDGPSPVTDTVLDVLADKQAKATFFVKGVQLHKEGNVERIRRIAHEEHAIGIHTYTHDYEKIYSSVDAFLSDFYEVWKDVKEITGVSPNIFRFPGGSINVYNGTIYQEIIAEMTRRGFVYFDWNASSNDAASIKMSAENILYSATQSQNFSRIILLMHDSDSKSNTAKALPQIIDYYISNGYVIAPLKQDTNPVIFGYRY